MPEVNKSFEIRQLLSEGYPPAAIRDALADRGIEVTLNLIDTVRKQDRKRKREAAAKAGREQWEHPDAEVVDRYDSLCQQLTDWDRFYGGMLIDMHTYAAMALRTALLLSPEKCDEQLMAEWVQDMATRYGMELRFTE